MTLSLWRWAHLVLALLASTFILIASLTGIILGIDAALSRLDAIQSDHLDQITLAEALPVFREAFPEITEISVENGERVLVKGLDAEWNELAAYVDPSTGEILGEPVPESSFIQWVMAFHRSLFLKSTGRLLIGAGAFCLILIAISGIFLVIQRQNGILHFFSKIPKEGKHQYYHVELGRWTLVPILVLALSGTYLFLDGFNIFPATPMLEFPEEISEVESEYLNPEEFQAFQEIHLSDLQKVEFPFAPDPNEFFKLTSKNSQQLINQFSGAVIQNVDTPTIAQLKELNLVLHTGKTSWVWALILTLASANILYFIYSGIVIWRKRTRTKIKNIITPDQAEIVLIVGTENGSTLGFASAIHRQLLANGTASYLCEGNAYQHFHKANQILVFTATHGQGEASANASKLLSLINQTQQPKDTQFSVIGFGSKSYPDYCAFAVEVDRTMTELPWFQQAVSLHTVNDKNAVEFTDWVKAFNNQSGFTLATTPAVYAAKPTKLKTLKVMEKVFEESDQTFQMTLKVNGIAKFTSGDLLAIYPANDERERLYSIGKCKGKIQLVVKLHPGGFGSGFLNCLEVGDQVKARIIANQSFHLPKKVKSVAMIANGTGIAPFLGMMQQNGSSKHLYVGFRTETTMTQRYNSQITAFQPKNSDHLSHWAFSRKESYTHPYVMDLIQRDSEFFAQLLAEDGVVMICGSLAMQRNVEAKLDEICLAHHKKGLSHFKAKGQVLVDCY